jgi:hypothetical protein
MQAHPLQQRRRGGIDIATFITQRADGALQLIWSQGDPMMFQRHTFTFS